jgi:hypothetical protein
MLSFDARTLFFTIPQATGTLNDIGAADAVDGGFANARTIPGLSSPTYDGQPFFAAGQAWFSSHRDDDGGKNSDLYWAAGDGTTFGAVTLGANVSTPNDEQYPVLSEDGLTLYFARQASGSLDIFRTTRGSTQSDFGSGTLVDELNAGGAIDWPGWLSLDGCRLYFSSNRRGLGFDVYVAERTP